jgi:hypothetical protein
MKQARNEKQLAEFVRRWGHHKIMNKWLWRVFQYLVSARRFPALLCGREVGFSLSGTKYRTDTMLSTTVCPNYATLACRPSVRVYLMLCVVTSVPR